MNIPAHYLTRRSALGVIGAGSAAVVLAACSTSNSNGGGGSDSSKRDDYSGEVKFEKFDTSAGNYEPATREHPAKNVPKPIKPDNLNEKSVEGFYQNIAFIVAGMQYLYMTVDGSALKESNITGKEQLPKLEEQMKSSGSPDKFWSEDFTVKASLDTPQPKIEGDTYTWEGKISTNLGSFMVRDGQTMRNRGVRKCHIPLQVPIKTVSGRSACSPRHPQAPTLAVEHLPVPAAAEDSGSKPLSS